jgi:hypothetical protein
MLTVVLSDSDLSVLSKVIALLAERKIQPYFIETGEKTIHIISDREKILDIFEDVCKIIS